MSRRVALVLAAALLVGAVAAFSGATPAFADGTVTALSPDDASALIAGTATSGVTATSAVDPSTALAAASAPDAVTSVDPDLTLDQAVGLDPAPTDSPTALRSVSSTSSTSSLASFSSFMPTMCWANAYWSRWGTWPYEQKITDTTYWCAIYGSKVTYRTSSVTGGGTLCSVNWRASQLIGGGVGFPSFTMRSSAGFSCPTVIPWIVLHPTHYMDVRRDSRGGTVLVASG
jgi:hypothetical protein